MFQEIVRYDTAYLVCMSACRLYTSGKQRCISKRSIAPVGVTADRQSSVWMLMLGHAPCVLCKAGIVFGDSLAPTAECVFVCFWRQESVGAGGAAAIPNSAGPDGLCGAHPPHILPSLQYAYPTTSLLALPLPPPWKGTYWIGANAPSWDRMNGSLLHIRRPWPAAQSCWDRTNCVLIELPETARAIPRSYDLFSFCLALLAAQHSRTDEMASFAESRRAVEAEGVYIGGWSIKNAFIPDKTRGKVQTLPILLTDSWSGRHRLPLGRLASASFEA